MDELEVLQPAVCGLWSAAASFHDSGPERGGNPTPGVERLRIATRWFHTTEAAAASAWCVRGRAVARRVLRHERHEPSIEAAISKR